MDVSKLREVCKKYSALEYFVDPIPEPKLRDARARLKIPPTEQAVALIDFALKGKSGDALVITDGGIHWRNCDNLTHRRTWAQLQHVLILENKTSSSKLIRVAKHLELDLQGADSLVDRDNHLVLNLLNEIKALAVNQAKVEDGNSLRQDSGTGLVDCEFCNHKIKPGVIYCKHCGMKLLG